MSTPRSGYRFIHRLRVRWAEVDMQKIVFNAHYLMYFDTAVADYWRALGLPYEEAMHQLGGDLYVKKASLEYHGSARYDDVLEVGLRCAKIGNSSMVFEGGIFHEHRLLISCELIYVFADPATQTSKPVPPTLRGALEDFEARAAMVQTQVGDWDTLQVGSMALRRAVFADEQGIDNNMMSDAADATAVHAVSFNRLGQPVATGRLLQHAPDIAKIGRMATHRVLRGANLGRDVLWALQAAAKARGDREVVLHAQCSAEGFYKRLGYTARGAVFEEAGIQHIEMVLPL